MRLLHERSFAGPRRIAALVLAVACLGACGSSGSDDGGAAGAGGMNGVGGGSSGSGGAGAAPAFLACPGETQFHLVGNVGDASIELTEAPTTGGFSQGSDAPGPNFRVPNSESEDDEQLVVVFLTWEQAVASGEITPVEGWVRLPVDSPLPNETICAAEGSVMTIPLSADETALGDFQFVLRGLSGGSDCSEPLTGELRGCWRN